MACSSNAILSAAATKPWVGRTQAVGQRVIPLMRINSATASHSFSGMIHLASSRIIERVVIVEFAICLSLACSAGRRFVTECIHSCQWVKWLTGDKMVNATKSAGFARRCAGIGIDRAGHCRCTDGGHVISPAARRRPEKQIRAYRVGDDSLSTTTPDFSVGGLREHQGVLNWSASGGRHSSPKSEHRELFP